MKDDEPRHGLGGEAAHHAAYLDFYRRQLIDGVLDLSPEDRRRTRLPSGWSPIELLSHVLHMEQRWFVWSFLAEPVDDPWGDWTDDDPWDAPVDSEARWHVRGDVTAEHLADRLRALGLRTTELLGAHDLDEIAADGARSGGDPADLRWICFHVLQEYARHAGHLDISVELARG
ncbi:MAG: hypothetical protein JWN22_3771 [Nocardioides sp.]|nr:hypothetical protein [Nocardioides sp.]